MEWYAWYGVRDLFFDGATTGTGNGQLGYYRSLYAYVHQHVPGSQVWINPGWYPSSSADQPNYSALPAYWRAEDAAVAAECGT